MQNAWMAVAVPHLDHLPIAAGDGKRRAAWKAAKKTYVAIVSAADATADEVAEVATLMEIFDARTDSITCRLPSSWCRA